MIVIGYHSIKTSLKAIKTNKKHRYFIDAFILDYINLSNALKSNPDEKDPGSICPMERSPR